MSFFHTKSVAQLQSDAENSKLSKNLSVFDLTFLGVGGIIGAGVFVLTGIAAARYAGPGVALSFVIAGILCILVGLTYSEFSSFSRLRAVSIPTPLPPSAKAWPSSAAGPCSWPIRSQPVPSLSVSQATCRG